MRKGRRFAYALSVPTLLFGVVASAFAVSDIASLPVNLGASGIANVLYVVAFIGGALMILTPCSAATIPAYFANTFGVKGGGSKWGITKMTSIFFLGFAVVYAFMGGGASLIGRLLNLYQEELAVGAGVLLLVFGVMILIGKGFFSFSHAPKTQKDRSVKGTFAFGALFGVGFSGCAGPVLAAILTIASQLTTTQAVLLMFFYSLGMGVPLLLLSLVFDRYKVFDAKFFRWHKEVSVLGRRVYLTLPNLISGVLLLALGVVFILFRSTSSLSATFPRRITEIGYALQDWLLAIKLPGYVDTFILVLVGFILWKLIARASVSVKLADLKRHLLSKSFRTTVVIIAIIVAGLYALSFYSAQVEQRRQLTVAKELARPPEISVTMITAPDCSDCYDPKRTTDILAQQGLKIVAQKELPFDSDEARALIERYGIERVPTIIAEGEVRKGVAGKLFDESVGSLDGETFVLRKVPPPYMLTESGETRGEFSLVYLVDTSCAECYDVRQNALALSNLGLSVKDDRVVEVFSAEGRALRRKYAITSVPTFLITGDLGVYEGLKEIWPRVGTTENDGTYVFRNLAVMGTYKDLKTGKVVVVGAGGDAPQGDDSTPVPSGKESDGR